MIRGASHTQFAVQQFFFQNQSTGFGHLALVNQALGFRDVMTAAIQNNFNPANNLEAKQQFVNGVKVKIGKIAIIK